MATPSSCPIPSHRAPVKPTEQTQQIALVKAITAPPYATMKESSGASPGWVARGIGRYIKDRGYAVDRLDWRPVIAPAPGSAAVPAPGGPRSFTLDEIKSCPPHGGLCVDLDRAFQAPRRRPGHL